MLRYGTFCGECRKNLNLRAMRKWFWIKSGARKPRKLCRPARFHLQDIRLCCLDCVFIFVFVWTSVYWSEHQPCQHQPVHHIPSSRHRCICEFVWTENYTYQPGQHHPVHQIPSSRHPSVLSGLSAGTRSSLSSSSLGGKQDGNGWWWRFTMADPSSIWLTTL